MDKNNSKQDNVKSIFRYNLFRLAVGIPIAVSIIVFWYISSIAQLSFDITNFENFELFLTFMKFPLLIASLALPFGTVAASNFRSIQFQINLNNQQAMMVQTKHDFVRSLYFKELEYFVGKFKAIVKHEGFKVITELDGHLIYARMYELSLEKGEYPFKKNMNLFESIGEYFTELEKVLLKFDEDVKTNSNINLICLMNWLVESTLNISHGLGVKVIIRSDSLNVMCNLVNEIYGICMSLYQEENLKKEPIQKILDEIQKLQKECSIPTIDSTTIQALEMSEEIKAHVKHIDIRKQSNQKIDSYSFNLNI